MKGEYKVIVTQGVTQSEAVAFVFSQLCDAIEFVGTCLECGTDGTIVRISRIEED